MPEETAGKHPETILLIESDSAIAALIRKLLAVGKKQGIHLEWEKSVAKGLERLRQGKIAAVLLDLDVLDKNVHVLEKVQRQSPRTPIIVLVDDPDEERAAQLLQKGAQACLAKAELSSNVLSRTIRHAVECKRALEALRKSEMRYRRLSRDMERAVEKKAAQLRQAESMAAIGRMVSILAHEIRNPLQSIKMAAENFRSLTKHEGEMIELLEEINHGAHLLEMLVNDLLEYSRPISLRSSSQPLRAVFEQPLKKVSARYPAAAVKIDLELPDNEIFVDLPQIQIALENIIANAFESMPAGGTLKIRSCLVKRAGSECIRITIADTGAGIKQEDLRRVDEPFFTTKVLGTGLGFPLAKKIIEAHRGIVGIRSKPGKGTAIELVLPAPQK